MSRPVRGTLQASYNQRMTSESPIPGPGGAETERSAASGPGSQVSLLKAIELWERLPHNLEGSDKSWVERLVRDTGEHLGRAHRAGP